MAQPTTIQSFGKYQILERIATGSTAEIYKARLEGVGGFQRTFAIKRIRPDLSRNDEYVSMLVEEAKVAGLLSHANIVQIVDLGQVDGAWYIAMEYVDGQDLGAVLQQGRRKGTTLPVPHSVFIAVELLKGLEYAHTREVMKGGRPVTLNIIHRDVSPQNVLISFQGEVKLTDFGIARASLKAKGTIPSTKKGRFDYTSPEQVASSPKLDQRADLFAVGVLLYEMLTGRHPFRGDTEAETIGRIEAGDYPPVSKVRPEVPASLVEVVDRALAVDPDQRFASATDFKEALDQFFHESGFIFTHSTLSTYVQGLFPDGRPPLSFEGGASPAPRRDPTPNPASPPPTQELGSGPFSDAFADLADDTDQETLIRRMPEGWDDESPAPAKPPPPPEPAHPSSPELAPARPTANVTTAANGRSANNTGRTSPVRRQVVQGGRGTFEGPQGPVIGGALVLVAVLFGVGLGVMLMTLVLVVSGYQLVGRDEPVLAAPRISVVGPPSVIVRIDGERVGPNVQVSHGNPHTIDVRLGGRVVFSEDLVLNRGEHRVVVLSAADEGR